MHVTKLLQTQISLETALNLLHSTIMNTCQQVTLYEEVLLLLNIHETQENITEDVLMNFDQVRTMYVMRDYPSCKSGHRNYSMTV